MQSRTLMNRYALLGLMAVGLLTANAAGIAQDKKNDESAPTAAQTLEQLLQETRQIRARETQANAARERRFLAERNRQAELLADARRERAAQEARSRQLSATFDANERKLIELQAVLDAKGGNLGELFGMVRQSAGDAAGVFNASPITARFPERIETIAGIAGAKGLPSIDRLEELWFEIQREMTETGRSVRFETTVVRADGTPRTQTVVNVGPFMIMSDGRFLSYLPSERTFAVLSKQPQRRFRSLGRNIEKANKGTVKTVIDPTRGELLRVLVQRPGVIRTIRYGSWVGYGIMLLGAWGLWIAIRRYRFLRAEGLKVDAQRANIGRLSDDNALGRVLKVYESDPKADMETLQLRLDEAVLKEIPALESGLPAIKIIAAVGPLAGLLGTVTGMILTFQQITLFGTGDPKVMAEGISQALVTTVLGLCVAIPLVLIHSFLHARSKAMIQVLEEESAGLIAEHTEKAGGV
jgi:biopolymer transport protein ExbB